MSHLKSYTDYLCFHFEQFSPQLKSHRPTSHTSFYGSLPKSQGAADQRLSTVCDSFEAVRQERDWKRATAARVSRPLRDADRSHRQRLQRRRALHRDASADVRTSGQSQGRRWNISSDGQSRRTGGKKTVLT